MSDKIYKIYDIEKQDNNDKASSLILKEIDTLISLEKYDDAYILLNDNFDNLVISNFKEYTNMMMGVMIELKKETDFNSFFEKIKNLPYQNVAVLEDIQNLPTNFLLMKKEKDYLNEKKSLRFDIQNIYKNLTDESLNNVFLGLNDLKEFESKTDLFSGNTILAAAFKTRKKYDYAKAMIFVQLVTRKYDERLSFFNNGKMYFINPKDYEIKYSEYLKEVSFYLNKVKDEEKNITVAQIFNNLFVPYIMINLPEFFSNQDLFNVYVASIIASYVSISADYKEDNLLNGVEYPKRSVNKIVDKILNLNCF